MRALITTISINWGRTALVWIDTFTGWRWLLGIWHQANLCVHIPPKWTTVFRVLEEQLKSNQYKRFQWMPKHFLVSACEVEYWQQASSPPPIIAVQNFHDFSVSALYFEDEPASISWYMRTQRKSLLSGEPLLWGGYLELFLHQRSHCCFLEAPRRLLSSSPVWFYF